jgi:hypothetical protein
MVPTNNNVYTALRSAADIRDQAELALLDLQAQLTVRHLRGRLETILLLAESALSSIETIGDENRLISCQPAIKAP